jgi:hypothetical protein
MAVVLSAAVDPARALDRARAAAGTGRPLSDFVAEGRR